MSPRALCSASLAVLALGCASSPRAPSPSSGPRFEEDVAFLARHGEVLVLEAPTGGRVALSAKYQGRVMTSAVGPGEASLGFVHRAFIEAGKTGTAFDNYGGEDRFWLGPEGSKHSLYFAKGSPLTFDAWRTPAAFQEGAWDVREKTATSVTFGRRMAVSTRSGATLELEVERIVRLLDAAEVEARVGVRPAGRWVAFESRNTITNVGRAAWTEATGLPSVWILGMFAPAPDARVIAPFDPKGAGPIVNDAYFGKVPPERLLVRDGHLVFVADGTHRSKIGLSPSRARSVVGSYSPGARLLTLVHYDKPQGPARYVNSLWDEAADPFAGDVVNSYNDGPPAPGKPPLGGFYELETSSPAAALAPGERLTHTHRTVHLAGAPEELEPHAARTLGVSLGALR